MTLHDQRTLAVLQMAEVAQELLPFAQTQGATVRVGTAAAVAVCNFSP